MKSNDYYNKWRRCQHCLEEYQEKNNIGQLNCRIHPGIIVSNENNRYYTCCGILVDSNRNLILHNGLSLLSIFDTLGCVKIDHFDQDYLLQKNIELFSLDDLFERVNQIKSISWIALPDQLLIKSKKECILESFNVNNCCDSFNKYSNFFTNIKPIVNYNLNISKNAVCNYNKIKLNENDNIEIDLYEICKIIDSLIDNLNENNKNNSNLIDEIWNNNIQIDDTYTPIIKQSDPLTKNFSIIKRINYKMIYNKNGFF